MVYPHEIELGVEFFIWVYNGHIMGEEHGQDISPEVLSDVELLSEEAPYMLLYGHHPR